MNPALNSISTIEHLPQEVFYMIMDLLTYSEKLNCRLINNHFMRMASYIFKTVHFTSRERVKFFAKALVRTPCIASHVQVILVDKAALLRAVNHTNIKQACYNVREINIVRSQGRGTWAQHLIPYTHLQHPPALMDSINSKIVIDNFAQQILTFRLGGAYLKSLATIDDIAQLIKRVPSIRTFGLHYIYKDKSRNIHFDIPQTFTFEELNTLLKQPPQMTKFELHFCEIADFSLITRTFNPTQEMIEYIRTLDHSPKTTSLFSPLQNLRFIEMKQVKVTSVTWFVQSILKSFPNLESLDIDFVARNIMLENTTGGKWDTPHPDDWSFELPISRLKKLALSTTHGRLAIPEMLIILGQADAPLEDIRISNSGHSDWEVMTVIRDSFYDTIKHLSIDSREDFGVERLQFLTRIQSVDLNWKHNDTDIPFCPTNLLESSPQITSLKIGYNTNCGRIRTYYNFYESSRPITNLTTFTLGRIILNKCEVKKLFLPLVNLKEAIFEYCVFDHQGETENEMLATAEMFDHVPEDNIEERSNLFLGVMREESLQKYGTAGEEYATETDATGNHLTFIPWFLRREIISIRSLSLEHLGLHDCRLRDIRGGIASAKTIRNFEVNQDLRSGCSETYNVDRAYHEKKNCNPHVVINQKKITEHRIGFHFTHEFGGVTGRNSYQTSRPTIVINAFSLEKLSIRPHALMSIYFTGKKRERLKTCNAFVKEQLHPLTPLSTTQTTTEPQTLTEPQTSTEPQISTESQKPIGPQTLAQAQAESPASTRTQVLTHAQTSRQLLSQLSPRRPIESTSSQPETPISLPRISSSMDLDLEELDSEPIEYTCKKSDEDEVKRIEELLAQVMRNEDNEVEGINLKEEAFNSDLFKAKIHSFCKLKGVEPEANSSSGSTPKKNKKTMQIRPF